MKMSWKASDSPFPLVQTATHSHIESGEGMFTAPICIDAVKKSRVRRFSVEVEIL